MGSVCGQSRFGLDVVELGGVGGDEVELRWGVGLRGLPPAHMYRSRSVRASGRMRSHHLPPNDSSLSSHAPHRGLYGVPDGTWWAEEVVGG